MTIREAWLGRTVRMEPQEGSLTLAERYLVGRQLAAGKNGLLMAARDATTGSPCLVKIYKSRDEASSYRPIEEELAMVCHLKQNPNSLFMNIFDILEEKGRWFAVFEYIEGLSLLDLISRHPSFLKKEEIVKYFLKALEPVMRMKPENGVFPLLQITPENLVVTAETVRVVDFEVQLLYGNTEAVLQNQQLLSEGEVLTQFGRILYTLITKQTPRPDLAGWRNPKDINPLVDNHLFNVLRQCADPRGKKRFESLEALHEAILHEPVPETRLSGRNAEPAALLKKQAAWLKVPAAAITVPAVLVLAVIVLAMLLKHRESPVRLDRKLLCAATRNGIQWLDPDTGQNAFTLPIPGTFSTLLPLPGLDQLVLADAESGTVFSLFPSSPQNASLLFADITLSAFAFDPSLHIFIASDGKTQGIIETAIEIQGNHSTIPLLGVPDQLVLDPSTHRVYAGFPGSRAIQVVDLLGHKGVATFTLPEVPDLVSADSGYLSVYLPAAKMYEVLSPTGEVTGSLPYAFTPPVHLYLAGGKNAVLRSRDPRLVFLVSGPKPSFTKEFPLGFTPVFAAADPESAALYLTGPSGDVYALSLSSLGRPVLLTKVNGLTSMALWNPQ